MGINDYVSIGSNEVKRSNIPNGAIYRYSKYGCSIIFGDEFVNTIKEQDFTHCELLTANESCGLFLAFCNKENTTVNSIKISSSSNGTSWIQSNKLSKIIGKSPRYIQLDFLESDSGFDIYKATIYR